MDDTAAHRYESSVVLQRHIMRVTDAPLVKAVQSFGRSPPAVGVSRTIALQSRQISPVLACSMHSSSGSDSAVFPKRISTACRMLSE